MFAWGQNARGQLGTGDTDPRSSPTVIATLSELCVVDVCAGEESTGAITFSGEVSGRVVLIHCLSSAFCRCCVGDEMCRILSVWVLGDR